MVVVGQIVFEDLGEEHGEAVGALGDAFDVRAHMVGDVDEEVFGESIAEVGLRLSRVRQRLLAMGFAHSVSSTRAECKGILAYFKLHEFQITLIPGPLEVKNFNLKLKPFAGA